MQEERRDKETGHLLNPWGEFTSYQRWQQKEGVPSLTGFFVEDLKTVEVHPWPRKDARGTFINLEGTGGTNDAYVLEIAPGKRTSPQRHLFEELIYVLDGRGATTVWLDEKRKQTFEWGTSSLFSVPLNTWHQHFNGQGDKPARYMAVTTAPTVIDLFHNDEFVFGNDFVFRDRYSSEEEFFSGKGTLYPGRVWDSNFIPDVANFRLHQWKERGAGGSNVMFELANNTLCAHISEFPVGTYKKGHKHGPGAHVILINGIGYSLLWPEGEEMRKVDWHAGSMFVPPDQWFHQHFNAGREPARYLALRWGSHKYQVAKGTKYKLSDVDRKQGGPQIDYDDEDPRIHDMFKEALAKVGIAPQMSQFFTKRKV